MTNEELSNYYANLLIFQYINKPKAYAMVAAQVLPVFMDQLPVAVQEAFNVNTAIGVQLDVIGKYVGVSRNGYTLSGPVTLGDDDYRQLIKMVIIKNNSGSSLSTIQSLLAANFPGQILVSDNQTMGLNYVLIESLGTSDLLEILATGVTSLLRWGFRCRRRSSPSTRTLSLAFAPIRLPTRRSRRLITTHSISSLTRG
jgi:hypothetical protein